MSGSYFWDSDEEGEVFVPPHEGGSKAINPIKVGRTLLFGLWKGGMNSGEGCTAIVAPVHLRRRGQRVARDKPDEGQRMLTSCCLPGAEEGGSRPKKAEGS